MSFVRYVNLRVPAGSAKPGPAIGQSLGPLGINMADFCKQFNEKSDMIYKKDTPLGVRLHAFSGASNRFCSSAFPPQSRTTHTPEYLSLGPLTCFTRTLDRSFTFDIRSPSTSWLIKKAVGLDKGPNHPDPNNPVAFITPEAVYEIAKIKHGDDMRWHLPLEGVARSVVGTARSMGVICREADPSD
jgi:large subunit ribosomal protein L11